MTRQLSAWAAFTHAVASVRDNIAVAFRVSWGWYAVILIVTAGLQYLKGDAQRPPGDPATAFSDLILAGLTLASSASIAVTWHRYILVDELPPGGGLFRFDGLTWRYLGNLLLIGLIIFVIMIPISIIGVFAGIPGPGLVLIIGGAIPLAGLLFLRLGLKLPAIALGDRKFSLRDGWRHTTGNSWQIIGLFALNIGLAFAMTLAIYAVQQVLGLASAVIATAVASLLQLAANWLLTIFNITVLTSLYGFFVQNRDF